MKRQLIRKTVHSILALSLIWAAPYVSTEFMILFGITLFSSLAAMRLLNLHTRVPIIPRATFGEFFFAIGVIATTVLAWPNILAFQFGMLILALADPFAALLGMRFGTHEYRIMQEKRTYEGSTVCGIVVLGVFLIFGAPIWVALVGGVLLAFVEAVSVRGSDNLFLPTIAALLYQFLLI